MFAVPADVRKTPESWGRERLDYLVKAGNFFACSGSSAYGAAKGAVEILTRYLAKELGPRRITANVGCTGHNPNPLQCAE